MIRKIFEWYAAFLTLSWSGGATSVASLFSYPQAARYFKEHDRPRGRKWLEDQRPLYNNRAHHYRIEQGEDGAYYDLVLYRTPLVRYFAPKGDTATVLLRSTGSPADASFLGRQRWGTWYVQPVHDASSKCYVPLSPHTQEAYTTPNGVLVPADWSAKLVVVDYDRTREILVPESAHRPLYTRRLSDGEKAERARMREGVKTLVDTLALRLPAFEASETVKLDDWPNRVSSVAWRERAALADFVRNSDTADPLVGQAFTSLAVVVYRWMFGRQVRAEFMKPYSDRDEVYSRMANTKEFRARDLKQPVTATQYRAELMKVLLEIADGRNKGAARNDLGQFPVKLPQHFVWQ